MYDLVSKGIITKKVIVRDYENFNDDQFLTDIAYAFESFTDHNILLLIIT